MAGGGVHIGTVYVKVEPDTKGFKKKVQDDLTDVDPTIKPDADTKEAEAQIDKAARDRKTKIKVEVDRSGLDRLQNAIAKFTSRNAEGMGGGPGGLGAMSSFLDTAVLVAAVTAVAAPAIALVTGALVAMPAALSAILVPIGAVMLGLDGHQVRRRRSSRSRWRISKRPCPPSSRTCSHPCSPTLARSSRHWKVPCQR